MASRVRFLLLPVIFLHFRFNLCTFGDHIFRFMRDCPTGKLQKSEFVAIYKELFPNGNAKTFSEFIFNVFDADGNGTIEAGFQNKQEYHFVLELFKFSAYFENHNSLKNSYKLLLLHRNRIWIKNWTGLSNSTI